MIKKGDKIKISENAQYNGQNMRWTETFVDVETLENGTILYHFSDSKIQLFFPKETCFFPNKRSDGHCFAFVLKKQVKAGYYLSGEYRFVINNDNVDIYYLGKKEYLGRGKSQDRTLDIEKILKNK